MGDGSGKFVGEGKGTVVGFGVSAVGEYVALGRWLGETVRKLDGAGAGATAHATAVAKSESLAHLVTSAITSANEPSHHFAYSSAITVSDKSPHAAPHHYSQPIAHTLSYDCSDTAPDEISLAPAYSGPHLATISCADAAAHSGPYREPNGLYK